MTDDNGAMLFDHHVRVLVQGITGRQGAFWTERMKKFGTEVVAGITPGKGGQTVHGVPVYDSAAAACEQHEVDASVLFVPPAAVKAAAFDALRCGIRLLVVLAEHVPVQDTMELIAEARKQGARVIGPNCPGIVVPGRYSLGIMPAWETSIFRVGTIGVVSRSGSLGTLVCLDLVRSGAGQSAFVGLGGDPIVGTTFIDVLRIFESDRNTEAVMMVGEVGGTMEEDAADFIRTMTKPVAAYVGGQSAPEGRRMGHAGAIVSAGRGSARVKMDALRSGGAHVVVVPSRIGAVVSELRDRVTRQDESGVRRDHDGGH